MTALEHIAAAQRIVDDSTLLSEDEREEFTAHLSDARNLIMLIGTGNEWVRETDPAWDGGGHGMPMRKRVGRSWVRVWRDGVWDVRGECNDFSTIPQDFEAAKRDAIAAAGGEA